MEDFIFTEAEPGETKPFDFEPSLFHTPLHINLQRSQGWKWYYVLHPKHRRIVASLYLQIDNGIASSSIRSPFGTIEHSDHLPTEVLYRFLIFVEARLRVLGVQKIVIKNPPLHYALEKGALLQTFLVNLGYTIVDAKVGAVRFTNNDFVTELNRLEKRKLKKSTDTNLSYRLLSNEKLPEVYSFIQTCRQRKGYSLSMTFEDLQHTMSFFPDRYLLFGVFLQDEIVAASVSIRVTSDILYNFYADHSKALRSSKSCGHGDKSIV